jgi:hypothetical protein
LISASILNKSAIRNPQSAMMTGGSRWVVSSSPPLS